MKLGILGFFLLMLFHVSAQQKNDILIVSKKPAQRWQDGLIAGNGVQGVMVMGNVHHESIVLNHEKFWVPAQNVAFDVPDMTKVVHEVRGLAKEGNFGAAGTRLYTAFGEENAKMFPMEEFKRIGGKQSPRFGLNYVHPGAYLNIDMPQNGEVKEYARSVNLSTGEVTVRWNDDEGAWKRMCFVSRSEDAMVLQIKNECGGKVDCSFALNEVPGYDLKDINKPEVVVDEEGVYFHTSYTNKYWLDDPEGYHILTKVDAKGGKISVRDGKINVEGANEVILKTLTEFLPKYSEKSRASLSDKLNKISNYKKSLAKHEKIHRELYERVSFQLTERKNQTYFTEDLIEEAKKNGPNPEFLECIFAVGRYAYECYCNGLIV